MSFALHTDAGSALVLEDCNTHMLQLRRGELCELRPLAILLPMMQ